MNFQDVRSPINPLDRSTIVNCFPKAIISKKETIFPGEFVIPAAPENDFSILHIGSSSYFRNIGEEQPPIEVLIPSVEVARSIVEDYCNGIVGSDGDGCKIGLFWLPGEITKNDIKGKYLSILDAELAKQKNWFKRIVEIADVLWVASGGRPSMISEDMRIAARKLNLSTKPWLADESKMELVKCRACKQLIDSTAYICPNCKVILDAKKFAEAKFEFAG